jgi:hypothetical protein
MQRNSEMKAILSLDLTSMQSLPTEPVSLTVPNEPGQHVAAPIFTTGHD